MAEDIVPTCGTCGNPLAGLQLKNRNRRRVGYCSRACRDAGIRGESNSRWIHGRAYDSEYKTWGTIKQRCRNVLDQAYRNYGARGIDVCDEWHDSFLAFLAYVGLKPSPKHSLGRIDNDGNYEPGNVRWETAKEQARNRRSTRLVFINAVGKTAVEWEELSGVIACTIRKRANRGWTGERLLSPTSECRPKW